MFLHDKREHCVSDCIYNVVGPQSGATYRTNASPPANTHTPEHAQLTHEAIARAHETETQGTLSALNWEHVSVADSLAMGDAAVRMAEGGVSSVACLGVDFMAESVRATLDSRGFQGVPVRENQPVTHTGRF